MKLRPIAWWRIVTSPERGADTSTSSSFITSGPPVTWMRMALACGAPVFGLDFPVIGLSFVLVWGLGLRRRSARLDSARR